MRRTHCILISSLLLFQVASSEPVATAQEAVDSQAPAPELTNQDVELYMKAMVVEKFNIERVDLKAALSHLDEIIAPYGMQIQYQPHNDAKRVVSLKTRSLTMSKNLSFLCQQVGYDWWVDNGVIIVGLAGSDEALVTEIIPVTSSTYRRLSYSGQ